MTHPAVRALAVPCALLACHNLATNVPMCRLSPSHPRAIVSLIRFIASIAPCRRALRVNARLPEATYAPTRPGVSAASSACPANRPSIAISAVFCGMVGCGKMFVAAFCGMVACGALCRGKLWHARSLVSAFPSPRGVWPDRSGANVARWGERSLMHLPDVSGECQPLRCFAMPCDALRRAMTIVDNP